MASPIQQIDFSAVSAKMVKRYTDGYRVAGTVVGIGTAIKVLSLFFAAVIAIVGFGALSNLSSSSLGSITGITGRGISDAVPVAVLILTLISAIFVGVVGFIIGILVCARGQMQRAVLDQAVHTSPFLDNGQRAYVMSMY